MWNNVDYEFNTAVDLNEFLNMLTTSCLAELWLIHCNLNNYDYDSEFDYNELAQSMQKHPECFGIDIRGEMFESINEAIEYKIAYGNESN